MTTAAGAGAKPEPTPTPETRPYWEATLRRELLVHRCEHCARATQHPRSICACGSRELAWHPCDGRARLHSYVIVERPEPVFADEAPFVLAVVELSEGARMTTRVTGVEPRPENLPLDLPLQLTWAERGAVNLPVFVPEHLQEGR